MDVETMLSLTKASFSLLIAFAVVTHSSQPLNANSNPLNLRQQGYLPSQNHETYEFDGEINQDITISLDSSQFDSYLELYDFDGRLIAENDNFNGTNSQISLKLPNNGIYTVVVRGIENSAQGNYTLAIQEKGRHKPELPELPQLPSLPGLRETHQIRQQQIKYHDFSAHKGENVTIILENAQFNPLITVYDPEEFAIASNNPSENRIRLKIAKTGTYRIAIQGNNPSEAGQYTLTINR